MVGGKGSRPVETVGAVEFAWLGAFDLARHRGRRRVSGSLRAASAYHSSGSAASSSAPALKLARMRALVSPDILRLDRLMPVEAPVSVR